MPSCSLSGKGWPQVVPELPIRHIVEMDRGVIVESCWLKWRADPLVGDIRSCHQVFYQPTKTMQMKLWINNKVYWKWSLHLFTFCFLVCMQWAYSIFLCTSTWTRIETMYSFTVWSVKSWGKGSIVCLHYVTILSLYDFKTLCIFFYWFVFYSL